MTEKRQENLQSDYSDTNDSQSAISPRHTIYIYIYIYIYTKAVLHRRYIWCGKISSENMKNVSLGPLAKFRNATISFVMTVCPSEWNDSTFVGIILVKVYIECYC